MAKPMPTLPPEGEKIIEFMPITWPRRSKVGPPELPRLMGASIWMKLVYCWLLDVAAERGDDARGHRVGEAEGIAHRHHPVADAQLLVVAEFHGRQRLVAGDLEQRDVGGRIGADQLGGEAAAVGQLDGDLLAGVHHMIVGDDKAGLVDDEAGTGADRLVRLLRMLAWLNWLKKSRNGAGIFSCCSSLSPSVVMVSEVMVTTAGLTRSTRSAKLKGEVFSSMRGVRAALSLAASWTGAVVGDLRWRGPAAAARRRPGRPPRWRRRCPCARRRGAGGLGRREKIAGCWDCRSASGAP